MVGLVYQDKVDAAIGTIYYIESRVAVTESHVPLVNAYSAYVVPRHFSRLFFVSNCPGFWSEQNLSYHID